MSRYVVMPTWDDVPHLSQEQKDELWGSIPPHQREARSKGIPVLGSGQIYPVAEDKVKVADFKIGPDWPRAYGKDVGWNWNGCVWLAQNPNTQELFLYNCYKAGHAEPAIHAAAIKARGEWIHGAIDPAANSSGQVDGKQLLKEYVRLGLHLHKAENAVETGIMKVWQLLSTGQLKVFESCLPWWEEFRNYQRDLNGRIVKENDHLMDATRYAVMTGLEHLEVDPEHDKARRKREAEETVYYNEATISQNWMG